MPKCGRQGHVHDALFHLWVVAVSPSCWNTHICLNCATVCAHISEIHTNFATIYLQTALLSKTTSQYRCQHRITVTLPLFRSCSPLTRLQYGCRHDIQHIRHLKLPNHAQTHALQGCTCTKLAMLPESSLILCSTIC